MSKSIFTIFNIDRKNSIELEGKEFPGKIKEFDIDESNVKLKKEEFPGKTKELDIDESNVKLKKEEFPGKTKEFDIDESNVKLKKKEFTRKTKEISEKLVKIVFDRFKLFKLKNVDRQILEYLKNVDRQILEYLKNLKELYEDEYCRTTYKSNLYDQWINANSKTTGLTELRDDIIKNGFREPYIPYIKELIESNYSCNTDLRIINITETQCEDKDKDKISDSSNGTYNLLLFISNRVNREWSFYTQTILNTEEYGLITILYDDDKNKKVYTVLEKDIKQQIRELQKSKKLVLKKIPLSKEITIDKSLEIRKNNNETIENLISKLFERLEQNEQERKNIDEIKKLVNKLNLEEKDKELLINYINEYTFCPKIIKYLEELYDNDNKQVLTLIKDNFKNKNYYILNISESEQNNNIYNIFTISLSDKEVPIKLCRRNFVKTEDQQLRIYQPENNETGDILSETFKEQISQYLGETKFNNLKLLIEDNIYENDYTSFFDYSSEQDLEEDKQSDNKNLENNLIANENDQNNDNLDEKDQEINAKLKKERSIIIVDNNEEKVIEIASSPKQKAINNVVSMLKRCQSFQIKQQPNLNTMELRKTKTSLNQNVSEEDIESLRKSCEKIKKITKKSVDKKNHRTITRTGTVILPTTNNRRPISTTIFKTNTNEQKFNRKFIENTDIKNSLKELKIFNEDNNISITNVFKNLKSDNKKQNILNCCKKYLKQVTEEKEKFIKEELKKTDTYVALSCIKEVIEKNKGKNNLQQQIARKILENDNYKNNHSSLMCIYDVVDKDNNKTFIITITDENGNTDSKKDDNNLAIGYKIKGTLPKNKSIEEILLEIPEIGINNVIDNYNFTLYDKEDIKVEIKSIIKNNKKLYNALEFKENNKSKINSLQILAS